MAARNHRIVELEEGAAEMRGQLDRIEQRLQEYRNANQVVQEEVRPASIRVHMPDKFESRKDDWNQFVADVKSYCMLTRVPAELQVDFAYRCLGKQPRKVWLSKRKAWEKIHPGENLTLDIFDALMQTVYENQDKAMVARNRLDTVYQGGDTLDRYIERITTLFGEIETKEELSMGEKLHRFKKGLREDLQDKTIIDPATGLPYEDLDVLISALTKYEAALGGGQRPPKRTRMGAPSGQVAGLAPPQPQGTGPGAHYYENAYMDMGMGAPGMSTPGMAAAHIAGGPPPFNPCPSRRDGAAPHQRFDTRVAIPPDRRCYSCYCAGHEFHMCPFKKLQNRIPLSHMDQIMIQQCLQQCINEGRTPPQVYLHSVRGMSGPWGQGQGGDMGSRQVTRVSQTFPAGAAQGTFQVQGRDWGRGGGGFGRGRGRGRGGRRGRGRGRY
jgi:hypothetical protein